VDTGSSISLIPTGTCSSEVRATSISQFCVICDKLEIKGAQDVEFHLKDRNYLYMFCVCFILTDTMELSVPISS